MDMLPGMMPEICFNPRSRGGSDLEAGQDFRLVAISVSIHAPAGGATNTD